VVELKVTELSARTSESSLMREPTSITGAAPSVSAPKPKPDRMRLTLRARHYRRRTEDVYVMWVKRFIFFQLWPLASRPKKHWRAQYEQGIYSGYQEGNDWWIGWIEEVPGVNGQERTREELLETLRITLKEALEFNREDALSAAGADFQEEKIAV